MNEPNHKISAETAQEWMSAHIDGMLNADETAALQAYIERTPGATDELDALKAVVGHLGDLPELAPPPDLYARIRADIDAEPTLSARPAFSITPWLRRAAGIAAVLLVIRVGYHELQEEQAPRDAKQALEASDAVGQDSDLVSIEHAKTPDEPESYVRADRTPAVEPEPVLEPTPELRSEPMPQPIDELRQAKMQDGRDRGVDTFAEERDEIIQVPSTVMPPPAEGAQGTKTRRRPQTATLRSDPLDAPADASAKTADYARRLSSQIADDLTPAREIRDASVAEDPKDKKLKTPVAAPGAPVRITRKAEENKSEQSYEELGEFSDSRSDNSMPKESETARMKNASVKDVAKPVVLQAGRASGERPSGLVRDASRREREGAIWAEVTSGPHGDDDSDVENEDIQSPVGRSVDLSGGKAAGASAAIAYTATAEAEASQIAPDIAPVLVPEKPKPDATTPFFKRNEKHHQEQVSKVLGNTERNNDLPAGILDTEKVHAPLAATMPAGDAKFSLDADDVAADDKDTLALIGSGKDSLPMRVHASIRDVDALIAQFTESKKRKDSTEELSTAVGRTYKQDAPAASAPVPGNNGPHAPGKTLRVFRIDRTDYDAFVAALEKIGTIDSKPIVAEPQRRRLFSTKKSSGEITVYLMVEPPATEATETDPR